MPRLEKLLSRILISDRLLLKSVYESTAKALRIDGVLDEPTVTTIGDVLSLHSSVKRFSANGMHGKYPELSLAIDSEIADALASCMAAEPAESWKWGADTVNAVPITSDFRKEFVKAFDRIAWAGLGGDE